MKKSTFISILALATALIGVAVSAAIYIARKREQEFEEFADELLDDEIDYFSAQVEDIAELEADADEAHPQEH